MYITAVRREKLTKLSALQPASGGPAQDAKWSKCYMYGWSVWQNKVRFLTWAYFQSWNVLEEDSSEYQGQRTHAARTWT